jgi:hypothetical protein
MRIVDTALYGNAYPLEEMVDDLTAAIFSADIEGTVNGFRRNLQMEYVQRLVAIVGVPGKSDYDTSARGIALLQLLNLRDTLVSHESQDAMTRAHRQLLVITIDHALDREMRGQS